MVVMAADMTRHQHRHSRRMRTRYTKENDGNTRRQQIRTHIGRALASFCVMCISLAALVRLTRINPYDTIDDPSLSSIDDYAQNRAAVLTQRYRHKYRNSNDSNAKRSYHKDIPIPKTDREKVDLILSGKFQLVNLEIDKLGTQRKSGYEGVKGHFCNLDWSQYKSDPSSIPMFKDLVKPCNARNSFTYDLKEIVNLATAMDNPDIHAMEPSGFIFHESRCGSTLVANALTAMDPEQHRVYSESRPLIRAIRACGIGGKECPSQVGVELIQDVVYIMGRTRDSLEKGLFFKIQSLGTKYIDVVLEAFPNTPWIFVYREPVQIITSQLKHGVKKANCVKQYGHISHEKKLFLTSIGRSEKELSPVEKCAVHLSTICDAAIVAISRSKGKGIRISYDNIVNKLIEDVIPRHFLIAITDERRERIIDVSGKYSKGRAHKAGEWKEDSKDKEELATSEIRQASKIFLYDSYNTLENL
mmetsp:Transcript_28901/g.34351  ORF Transcript_28901/g.34351 Transcript_28901/m.34351 type:complete len:473 (-) Transcript_28901:96-1514(-)